MEQLRTESENTENSLRTEVCMLILCILFLFNKFLNNFYFITDSWIENNTCTSWRAGWFKRRQFTSWNIGKIINRNRLIQFIISLFRKIFKHLTFIGFTKTITNCRGCSTRYNIRRMGGRAYSNTSTNRRCTDTACSICKELGEDRK